MDFDAPAKRFACLAARREPFAGRTVTGLADALPRVMSGIDENCTGDLTKVGAFRVGGAVLACTACTASRPMPVATSPAARTVATLAPIPIPPSATPLPTAPPPK